MKLYDKSSIVVGFACSPLRLVTLDSHDQPVLRMQSVMDKSVCAHTGGSTARQQSMGRFTQ